MTLLQAIVLAVVQGLTEFLPISSSGHLILARKLLHITMEEKEMLGFVVLVHLASALAVVLYARREVASLFTAKGRPLLMLLVAGTIPAAALGMAFNDLIEKQFGDKLHIVGIGLLVTAGALLMAQRSGGGTREYASFGIGRVLVVGLAQAVAMVPGISRSGSTICAGMALGLKREEAVRFSFLLAVPIILGATAKTMLGAGALENMLTVEYLAAFFVCFGVSLVALQLLVRIVRNKRLYYFAAYCAAAGLASIIWHVA